MNSEFEKTKLPNRWKWVKLGEVCETVSKGTTPLSYGHNYTSEGIPFLKAEDLHLNGINPENVTYFISEETDAFISRSRLISGDVLISIAGTLGRISFMPPNSPPANCNQAVCFIRLKQAIADTDYIVAILRSPYINETLTGQKVGGGVKNLNLPMIRNLFIPLPPLAEQKRIAGILTEQMAGAAKAKKACEEKLEAAEKLSASYLNQVFPQPGQLLPDGWRWVKLGDHSVKVGSGITPRGGQAAYHSTGIPLIRSQNVHHNLFLDEGIVFISEEQDAAMEGSRVQVGDVLLNITGASIGRVCVVPEEICPANVNQHVSILRFSDDIYPMFLCYYLSTPGFQRFILETQAGATRQALTKTLIEGFLVPFASLSEQKRIAGILTGQMTAAAKVKKAIEEELELINKLPASLLQQAFKGKL